MNIRHLSHHEIDFEQWDKIISSSGNGLIYAKSWYLNIVSPGWEALVSDDYSFVFPIPVKRKFKIPYIVQPPLVQQLGLFSIKPVNEQLIRKFIQKLPSYSYELNLNEANRIGFSEEQPNFVLDLQPGYETIEQTYSKNTIRNIKKARKYNLRIEDNVPITAFFELYKNAKHIYGINLLDKLIHAGLKHSDFNISGAFNQEGRLVAALCYSEFKNRLTYLIPASNQAGKESAAMFYLVDELIRRESGRPKVLDFEGSKIEGVARFYKGFGATNRPYYIIKNLRPAFLVGKI